MQSHPKFIPRHGGVFWPDVREIYLPGFLQLPVTVAPLYRSILGIVPKSPYTAPSYHLSGLFTSSISKLHCDPFIWPGAIETPFDRIGLLRHRPRTLYILLLRNPSPIDLT